MPRYDVMSCLKEVTGLQHGWGEGNVSAGQRESEEEVYSCFGTLRNNWLGAAAPEVSVGQLCCLPARYLIPQCHDFITGQLNQSKAKYQFEATP